MSNPIKIRCIGALICIMCQLFLSSQLLAQISSGCAGLPALYPIVEELRELRFKRPVLCEAVSKDQFIAFKRAQYLRLVSVARLEQEEITYKAIGLIPNDYPYARCISSDFAQGVEASYDAERKRIVIPNWKEVPPKILIHELTHALQDQYFDLHTHQTKANEMTDTSLAYFSLVEGDAITVERRYQSLGHASAEHEEEPEDIKPLDSGCTLPETIKLQYEFAYTFGPIFVERLLKRGGQKLISQAFLFPPRSTKEIIHKNAYGVTGHHSNTPYSHLHSALLQERLGQYTIRLILGTRLPKEEAILSAKGWVFDVISLLKNTPDYTIVWEIWWENEKEANDFMTSWRSYLNKRFGIVTDANSARFMATTHAPEPYTLGYQTSGTKTELLFRGRGVLSSTKTTSSDPSPPYTPVEEKGSAPPP